MNGKKNKDYANHVYFELLNLKQTPEEKYQFAFEKYKDFTLAFPLIVKYMCFFNMFDADLFEELINELEEKKPRYEESPKFHGEYLKKLACKKGIKPHLAKKISNMEVAQAEIQINKIKKQEKEFKKNKKKIIQENTEELRKELLDFCLEN